MKECNKAIQQIAALLDDVDIATTVDVICKDSVQFWALNSVAVEGIDYDEEDVALLASRILLGTP